MHKYRELLAFYFLLQATIDDDTNVKDRDTRTLIEATHSGWWYTAQLPHGKRIVMYTTSPSDPTARLARTASGFVDLLSQTTYVARTLIVPSLRPSQDEDEDLQQPLYELPSSATRSNCTVAGSSVLEPYASWEAAPSRGELGRGWCAVGDAALAFDPLSSQGIITALDCGTVLGALLARHLSGSISSDSSGNVLSGEEVVSKLVHSYELVREKYEKGRAYYYDVVRRFDRPDMESEPAFEEGSADGSRKAGKHEYSSFWDSQRVVR